MSFSIRSFEEKGIPALLALMQKLAHFEGYSDLFAVTEDDIRERGLGGDPQFYALVAQDNETETLAGMAILYLIPYTITLKPHLVLKEFYVDEPFRKYGVGKQLFDAVKDFGVKTKAGKMIWTVMDGNHNAERFDEQNGWTRRCQMAFLGC